MFLTEVSALATHWVAGAASLQDEDLSPTASKRKSPTAASVWWKNYCLVMWVVTSKLVGTFHGDKLSFIICRRSCKP